MVKEAFGTGASIDDARRDAFKKLGLDYDQTDIAVEFDIIEHPKEKTFGLFGGKPAKVRVWYTESPANTAVEYLKGIIGGMGITDAEIEIEENDDKRGAIFTLKGQGLSVLIGRRGETLEAIQYLSSLVANKVNNEYYRITINTGNYREKRDGVLEALARNTADKCIRMNKNIAFEPMNPYERRVIHTAVQDIEGASSWSVGEGAYRHVVVGPAGLNEGEEGEPIAAVKRGYGRGKGRNQRGSSSHGRGNGYRGKNGGHRGNSRPRYQSKVRDEAVSDIPHEQKKEAEASPLYGKIDLSDL